MPLPRTTERPVRKCRDECSEVPEGMPQSHGRKSVVRGLHHRLSAADVDRLAGDPTGLIGGEVENKLSHLFWLKESLYGDCSQCMFFKLRFFPDVHLNGQDRMAQAL